MGTTYIDISPWKAFRYFTTGPSRGISELTHALDTARHVSRSCFHRGAAARGGIAGPQQNPRTSGTQRRSQPTLPLRALRLWGEQKQHEPLGHHQNTAGAFGVCSEQPRG